MTYIYRRLVPVLVILLIIAPVAMKAHPSSGRLGLKTVVIDPGHGGKDPGALGKTKGVHEKHIVLSI